MAHNMCKYCWKEVSIGHMYIVICDYTPEVIWKSMEEEIGLCKNLTSHSYINVCQGNTILMQIFITYIWTFNTG